MKNKGTSEHATVIANSSQRPLKSSYVTPTNKLIKFANYFATKKLQKFTKPVKIANIDDSIFAGISFANNTFPERSLMAL